MLVNEIDIRVAKPLLIETAKSFAKSCTVAEDRTYCHIVDDLTIEFKEAVHKVFAEGREAVQIAIGETICFLTSSWQAREKKLEEKDIVVLDKWTDHLNRIMYQISPVDELLPNNIPVRQIAVSEEVLKAVKANLIDQFIYVGLGPGKTEGSVWIHIDF